MQFHGYELDKFQERAICAVDEGRSVIVAAPTGAGKTVIAEYAIEKHLHEGSRIVYTAPIKALSNQKFRDFSRTHPGKIGIMTGDVIINPDAPVLIMTTEIFRNIIFDAGGERLRDTKYVVFDEIHYLDDVERGTVWEECIIFAPPHISFICLSATIPNIEEFSHWVSWVRNREVMTIVEECRPVPLKVRIYVPEHGFRPISFLEEIQHAPRRTGRRRLRVDNYELIRHLQRSDQLPCLYFVFSRAGCREYALRFVDMKLLSSAEQREITTLFDDLCAQFDILRNPNTDTMRRLIRSGIAYHHAGILPALKEIIERLYTLGLIKLLFTTETFAVGVNMPARSVVFDNLMKHDGVTYRALTSREFNQMAGRAGRRGIDPVGYAYAIVVPGDFNLEGVKHTLSSHLESIESQFRLSYSSILNLYATYRNNIYDVVEKSFSNFTAMFQVNTMEARIRELEVEIGKLRTTHCYHGNFGQVEEYLRKKRQYNSHRFRGGRRHSRKRKGPESDEPRHPGEEFKLIACHNCKRKKTCLGIGINIEKHKREIQNLKAHIGEVQQLLKTTLRRKLSLLRRLGYINEEGLLPRGEVASHIFGYELQFTELYFDGFFEGLSEEAINVVANAIVHESRRKTTYRQIEEKNLRHILARAARILERIKKREESEGIQGTLKPLDPALTRALLDWCRGVEFEGLKSSTTEDDGDIVRSFRLTVDFLRQMRRAIPEPAFQAKLNKCISLIFRDVVDAEAQLRIDL